MNKRVKKKQIKRRMSKKIGISESLLNRFLKGLQQIGFKYNLKKGFQYVMCPFNGKASLGVFVDDETVWILKYNLDGKVR